MTGRSSRNKGQRGERMIVSALRRCFPDVRRGRQYDSARECDVEGTPFRIENKFVEKISYKQLHNWLERHTAEGIEHGDERPPILITKRSRESIMFHGYLEDLVKIVETLFYKYDAEETKKRVVAIFGGTD